ncbi:MAG: MFS transporter [Rhodospirillales bacterium]|nr:MFS transporter [Rhodospirillales bacterium]
MSERAPQAARGNAIGPALAMTFLVQVLMALPVGAASVLTVTITQAIGVAPSMLGVYVSIMWIGALLAVPYSGNVLTWCGPVRALQLCLVLTAAGGLLLASGIVPLIALGSFLMGVAVGPEVPFSMQLLSRITTPRQRPFVVSVKSTGWQAGMAALGLSAPILTAALGWQGCIAVYSLGNLALAIAQEPLRRRYDADHGRQPGRRASVWLSIRAVLRSVDLVRLTLATVILALALNAFMSFMVSQLTIELGYGLALAGSVYACGQVGAVAGRLVGGLAAGRWIAPWPFLILVGLFIAATSIALGSAQAAWPVAAVAAIAALTGAAGASWLGVALSEVSRCAPPDEVGLVTGGVLFFFYLTLILAPIGFASAAAHFGYGWAFIGVGVITVLGMGLLLLMPRSSDAPPP